MKRFIEILKIVGLFLLLPIDIVQGSKKSAYIKIKKMMLAANLL
jgi:hypothetical protein